MKKLMMTTVAALGFAALAQADVLNSTGFEEYVEYDFAVNTSDSGNPNTGTQYWTGKGDFSQTVLKTYAEAEIEAPANVPDAFKAAASNKTFLSVDTGNDVMYRKAGAEAGSVDLTQGAVFFDANVKFTASETDVVPSEGDKLLVWLKGDENSQTTNLVVTAGLYNKSTEEYDQTNFTVVGDYAADTWYRLTVKAEVENEVTTFIVYIDGEQVSATYEDGVFGSFPSLVESGSDSGKLIEAAGFQGTGALDNVVWTKTDPFPPEATYTLTLTGADFANEVTLDGVAKDITNVSEDLAVSKKSVEVVVNVGTEDGTFTAQSENVTISTPVRSTKVVEEEGEEVTYYLYTFTVTVEPKAEAEYTIALGFVPGGVIDEDVDLATQSKLSLDKDSIKEGEAAPTVTVMVDDDTLTVGTDYTVTTDYVAGTSKAGTYTITVTAVENSGYTGSNSITFTVTAAEPTTVVTPTAAEIESGKITVTEETTAIKVGGVDVSIDAFDVVGTTATVKAPVVADSAAEEDDAFVIDDKKDEVTINVNPVAGLYYGVSAATDLDALARPAALTQYDGTNAAEIFTVSKPGDEKGFFKVYSDVKE